MLIDLPSVKMGTIYFVLHNVIKSSFVVQEFSIIQLTGWRQMNFEKAAFFVHHSPPTTLSVNCFAYLTQ